MTIEIDVLGRRRSPLLLGGVSAGWKTSMGQGARAGAFHTLHGRGRMRERANPFYPWVVAFTLFSLAAIFLGRSAGGFWSWQNLGALALDGMTVAVAPVVLMVAVGAAFQGEAVSMRKNLRASVPWFARYLWTNVHSTVVFWVPVEALVLLAWGQARFLPAPAALEPWAVGLWAVLILVTALYLHTRTSLAPYLALHSNLPGTQAVLVSFRLTAGRGFWRALGVILCSTTVPLALSAVGVGGLLLLLGEGVEAIGEMAPHLVGLELMAARVLLVPALHSLYEELFWDEGREAVAQGVPVVLKPLLWLSRRAAQGAGFLPVVRLLVPSPAGGAGDRAALD